MYHKGNHNTTNRKRKRIKRVLTPRNRMRKRRSAFVPDNTSTKIHLAYSRKTHKKKRTKTIKRYRKRTTPIKGGIGGFSEEILSNGLKQFALDNDEIKGMFGEAEISDTDFDDITSLPLLMTIYSVLINPKIISESTIVNRKNPPKSNEKTKSKTKTDGIQLDISIGSAPATVSTGGGGTLPADQFSQTFGGKPSPVIQGGVTKPLFFNSLQKNEAYEKVATAKDTTEKAKNAIEETKNAQKAVTAAKHKVETEINYATQQKTKAEKLYTEYLESNPGDYTKKVYTQVIHDRYLDNPNNPAYPYSRQVELIDKYIKYLEKKQDKLNKFEQKINTLIKKAETTTKQFRTGIDLSISIGKSPPAPTEIKSLFGTDLQVENKPTKETNKTLTNTITAANTNITKEVKTVNKYNLIQTSKDGIYQKAEKAMNAFDKILPKKPFKQSRIKSRIETEISNQILMKYAIQKIQEIEQVHPHPDLLHTFLYFFDLLDFPSALAMISLYLNKIYEATKDKNMTFDQTKTYLEKNLEHYASIKDWQTAFNIMDEDEQKDMVLKYTTVTNNMNDTFARANSVLNSLFSSPWAPYDSGYIKENEPSAPGSASGPVTGPVTGPGSR